MDPLPANPLPNATALKPSPAPVAAVMPNNKSTHIQAAAASTAPVTVSVQNTTSDASGMDSRIASMGNPKSALVLGQFNGKLNTDAINMPRSDLTNQSFNYQDKSQVPCTSISTQAHTQRPDTALVDFTGDGLIVSALPNAHVRTSLQMAGYTQISLNQPANWCLPAPAIKALLRSPASGDAQTSISAQQKLVRVKGQWQLVQLKTAVNNRSIANRKSSSALQLQGQSFKAPFRAG